MEGGRIFNIRLLKYYFLDSVLGGAAMKPLIPLIFTLCWTGAGLSACAALVIPSAQPPASVSATDPAQVYLLQGDQAAGLRSYDQAIADYTQAIQLKPDYAAAYNNRGLAYALKSKALMENAIADYSQAIRLRPGYAYAYNNRGVAYMASGHPESALSDFNQAIRLDPGFRQAHSNRGNYYWRAGRYGLAVVDLLQANPAFTGVIVLLSALIGGGLGVGRRKHQKKQRDFYISSSL